jgi:hypothetical protein
MCGYFKKYVKISERWRCGMRVDKLTGNILPGFIVYKKGGNHPTKVHETLELAKTEAERLATINPGQSFEVYRVDYIPVGACRVTNCTWVEYAPPTPPGAE